MERVWLWQGGVNMERGDFISGEAWCKYKFEREAKKKKLSDSKERLSEQAKTSTTE